MIVRMASPTRRDNSSKFVFRQRVPKQHLDAVIGKTAFLEIKGISEPGQFFVQASMDTHVKFSLRTSDPQEAKARQAQALLQLEKFYRTQSASTSPLSHKQIVALSGEAYRFYVDQFIDNPGAAKSWSAFKAFNRACKEGRVFGVKPLAVGKLDDPKDVAALGTDLTAGVNSLPIVSGSAMPEIRFRDITDWLLAKNGLCVDHATRRALIKEIQHALTDAAWTLKRAAEGDYTPDLTALRFPKLERHRETITTVFDKWKMERQPASSTLTTWKTSIESFKNHLGHEDITTITEADVITWKDKLVAANLSAKTINSSYLASIQTLFSFAVQNKMIASNPAKDVKIQARARAGTSMLPYTTDEVSRLVKLALTCDTANFKWLLLLAVGTGARIGELAQLWQNSIEEHEGMSTMRIEPAPDSGSLKNAGSERRIPLHPTLVKLGFLDFVKSHAKGPLFYKKASGRTGARHASKGVTNRLSSWIRANGFTELRKAPNHALRHWWKTTAVIVGISNSVADHLQGHSSGNESETYRHYAIETLATEIAKMPFPGSEAENNGKVL